MRVVSDGTPQGTFVLDATGQPLRGVRSVVWGVGVEGEPILTLQVVGVPVDLLGEQRSGATEAEAACPVCESTLVCLRCSLPEGVRLVATAEIEESPK